MRRILVVGAGGQIGTELVPHLQKVYGLDNVIAADLKDENVTKMSSYAKSIKLDALNMAEFEEAVKKYEIDAIFNLVALLSATGEKNPELAWKINIGALINSLTLAKNYLLRYPGSSLCDDICMQQALDLFDRHEYESALEKFKGLNSAKAVHRELRAEFNFKKGYCSC